MPDKELTDKEKLMAKIELLKKLRNELLDRDITTARLAARNLSWRQEDGLAILKEAIFGDYQRTTKKAAAYGLRCMNGRMHPLGLEVLFQGLKHSNRTTKAACVKSLALMKAAAEKKQKAAADEKQKTEAKKEK